METDGWKKSEVVIPDRTEETEGVKATPIVPDSPESIVNTSIPLSGDVNGGLDNIISSDVSEFIENQTESKKDIPLNEAINLIEFKGRKEHIDQYKIVAKSQFEENSMGGVETPSGIPVGIVYSLIHSAEKEYPELDLTKHKIIVNVKLRNNCKKCAGKGYLGRIFDPVTKEITDRLMQCSCLKLKLDIVDNPKAENLNQEVNSDDTSDSEPN